MRNLQLGQTNKSGFKGVSWDLTKAKWFAAEILKRQDGKCGSVAGGVAEMRRAVRANVSATEQDPEISE